MTMSLIVPDDVPNWVPGRLTVRSPDEGWPGVSVRGYRYAGLDVTVPPIRDYMIVAYRRGTTTMRRRVDGEWVSESLRPGDVSLLTRAAESHWVWPEDIEVVHVYLTEDEVAATCREMYEREVEDVELLDEVKADDPAIHAARSRSRGRPRTAGPAAGCWSARCPASWPCTSCAVTRTCCSASRTAATG